MGKKYDLLCDLHIFKEIKMGGPVEIKEQKAPPIKTCLKLYKQIGAEWGWRSRLNKSYREIEASLKDARVRIHFALINNSIIGYSEARIEDRDLAYIRYFGLKEGYIGCGYGKIFMRKVLENFRKEGVSWASLSTNTDNHPLALSFYKKSGFRLVHTENN